MCFLIVFPWLQLHEPTHKEHVKPRQEEIFSVKNALSWGNPEELASKFVLFTDSSTSGEEETAYHSDESVFTSSENEEEEREQVRETGLQGPEGNVAAISSIEQLRAQISRLDGAIVSFTKSKQRQTSPPEVHLEFSDNLHAVLRHAIRTVRNENKRDMPITGYARPRVAFSPIENYVDKQPTTVLKECMRPSPSKRQASKSHKPKAVDSVMASPSPSISIANPSVPAPGSMSDRMGFPRRATNSELCMLASTTNLPESESESKSKSEPSKAHGKQRVLDLQSPPQNETLQNSKTSANKNKNARPAYLLDLSNILLKLINALKKDPSYTPGKELAWWLTDYLFKTLQILLSPTEPKRTRLQRSTITNLIEYSNEIIKGVMEDMHGFFGNGEWPEGPQGRFQGVPEVWKDSFPRVGFSEGVRRLSEEACERCMDWEWMDMGFIPFGCLKDGDLNLNLGLDLELLGECESAKGTVMATMKRTRGLSMGVGLASAKQMTHVALELESWALKKGNVSAGASDGQEVDDGVVNVEMVDAEAIAHQSWRLADNPFNARAASAKNRDDDENDVVSPRS